MAEYKPATGGALQVIAYESKLFLDTIEKSLLLGKLGNPLSPFVDIQTDLEKNFGDVIKLGFLPQLTGDPLGEGESLAGQENTIVPTSDTMTLTEMKRDIRIDNGLARQRGVVTHDAMDLAKMKLMEKLAFDLEKKCFSALRTSPTTYVSQAGGTLDFASSSPVSSLVATDTLSPALLQFARSGLETGWNDAYPAVEPVMINGEAMYVVIIHPDAAYDLKRNSEYNAAVRDAQLRGKENPIFTGAIAIIDGFIIHTSRHAQSLGTGGSGAVRYCHGHILGKHALSVAFGAGAPGKQKITFFEGRDALHDEYRTMNYKANFVAKKPSFSSHDYAAVSLMIAHTAISSTL